MAMYKILTSAKRTEFEKLVRITKNINENNQKVFNIAQSLQCRINDNFEIIRYNLVQLSN